MTDAAKLFERCQRFERDIFVDNSPVIEPWSHGRAFFHPELRDMWDRNLALVETDASGADPNALQEELEAMFAARQSRHRKLRAAENLLSRDVIESFREAGWIPDRLVTMAYTSDRPPSAPALEVQEVPADEYRTMTAAAVNEDPERGGPEIVDQIVESSARMAAEANARFFAVTVDGGIVSGCHLYSDGTTAQIEDVATLSAYRRKGLSAAVMRHAVRAAFEAEHELVFLVADDEDWPKEFYGRLGFEPVGYETDLLRKPATA